MKNFKLDIRYLLKFRTSELRNYKKARWYLIKEAVENRKKRENA